LTAQAAEKIDGQRRRLSMPRLLSTVSLCVLALALHACSSRRPPTAKLSTADLAVREASDRTASEHAPLDLRLAREKLDKARAAVDDNEYDRAERYADQALVDAQVAEAKSRAAQSEETLQQTRQNIEALRREAEHSAVTR
jgi:hypothetical protein